MSDLNTAGGASPRQSGFDRAGGRYVVDADGVAQRVDPAHEDAVSYRPEVFKKPVEEWALGSGDDTLAGIAAPAGVE